MTRLRPAWSLAVVMGLLAVGVLTDALVPAGAATSGPARTAAVIGAAAVCPDLRQSRGLTTRVSAGVALADDLPAGTAAGTITAEPLRLAKGARPAALPVTRPGQVAVGLGAAVDGDALVVRAAGPLAAGLELEQVTRGESGGERGLAGLRCGPPTPESWFVGGSSAVGDAALLVLANSDETPAIVDVTVWTGNGPVDPRPGMGISVPPRSRAAIGLDQLAPDQLLTGLRVAAQRGRVAAALRHARFDGLTPRGVDWVPRAQPPATTVVVPGLPKGPGRRVVLVTNPGADPTLVSLRLTEVDRQVVPPGLDAIAVPAGTTVATDVTAWTNRSPGAVTVTSDGGPVLAGVFRLRLPRHLRRQGLRVRRIRASAHRSSAAHRPRHQPADREHAVAECPRGRGDGQRPTGARDRRVRTAPAQPTRDRQRRTHGRGPPVDLPAARRHRSAIGRGVARRRLRSGLRGSLPARARGQRSVGHVAGPARRRPAGGHTRRTTRPDGRGDPLS